MSKLARYCLHQIIALLSVSAAQGADLIEEPAGKTRAVAVSSCVNYTNLGSVPAALALVNSCANFVTVEVRNRHSSGRLASERTFHLNPYEERRIAFPGLTTTIVDVTTEFVPGRYCQEGTRFATLRSKNEGDYIEFSVRNSSSDRHLAVYAIWQTDAGSSFTRRSIAPGKTDDRFWGHFPDLHPRLHIKWTCLDPH